MKLVRLVYFSRATRDMSLSDLKNILQTARSNNSQLDVCGMLCYENRYFLQALEGERDKVNELYLDIADDPRHSDVTIVGYDEVAEPKFKQWNMGYAASSDAFYQILKQSAMSEFSPELMNKDSALDFLFHMADYQSDI